MTTRRSFLVTAASLLVAPAVVRASSLMPMSRPQRWPAPTVIDLSAVHDRCAIVEAGTMYVFKTLEDALRFEDGDRSGAERTIGLSDITLISRSHVMTAEPLDYPALRLVKDTKIVLR